MNKFRRVLCLVLFGRDLVQSMQEFEEDQRRLRAILRDWESITRNYAEIIEKDSRKDSYLDLDEFEDCK